MRTRSRMGTRRSTKHRMLRVTLRCICMSSTCAQVMASSRAETSGMCIGDVLLTVNGTPVTSPKQVSCDADRNHPLRPQHLNAARCTMHHTRVGSHGAPGLQISESHLLMLSRRLWRRALPTHSPDAAGACVPITTSLLCLPSFRLSYLVFLSAFRIPVLASGCAILFKLAASVQSTHQPVVGFTRPRVDGSLEEHQVVVEDMDGPAAPGAGDASHVTSSLGLLRE